jgi:DNA-binding response OmpR family regulator
MQQQADESRSAAETTGAALPHLLVHDPEPAICEVLKLALEADIPCRVSKASTPIEAVTVLRRQRPRAAIIDMRLPAYTSTAIASQALALGVSVLITAGDLETRSALAANGVRFLGKPFHLRQVIEETRWLLRQDDARRRELMLQLARLAENLAGLDTAMRDFHLLRDDLHALLRRVESKSPKR